MIIKLLYLILFFLLGSVLTLFLTTRYQDWTMERAEKRVAPPTVDWLKIQKEVLPEEGFNSNVAFDDLGPKLVEAGAINLNRFEQNFALGGGLTAEQKEILTKKTDIPISIDRKNATFMVDFFWALGLTNKNPILDTSPMTADKKELGTFASTGGWTLGTKKATDLFSKVEIIKLTAEQQSVVEEVAQNVYRPCCNNPTSFPDCNHGMAALGLAEYLSSKGKSAAEIYRAILYFNSFWFPQNYLDVAAYFSLGGVNWTGVNPRIILGPRYSSGQGYASIKQELDLKLGVSPPVKGSGPGCGT